MFTDFEGGEGAWQTGSKVLRWRSAAFQRGDIGADKYQAFQREIEETRGKLNKYKADLSDLQTEQDSLSTNTARLEKLFAATGTEVDDYADVLGSRTVRICH